MEDMNIAMGMIAVCLMLVIKLGHTALVTLKAKYVAQGSINAIQLLSDDQEIDAITDSKRQAVARLSYKIKRDRLLSNSKVVVANAIAESN
jgi:hypothetical protein